MRLWLSTALAVLLVASVLLTGCAGPAAPQTPQPPGPAASSPAPASSSTQTLTISGAFALYPLGVRWSEAYKEAHPETSFDVSAGGAGKGMTDVLSGAVDIAMVSREVRPEEIKQGAFPIGVTKDAVVYVINEQNPVLAELTRQGATAPKLAPIWLSDKPGTWGALVGSTDKGGDQPIHPYTRADASGAGEIAAKYLGAKSQEELKGVAVQGDPGLVEAVRKDSLGIGYNNIGFAYDPGAGKPVSGVRIVPLDLNNNGQVDSDEDFYASRSSIVKAIADGKYPSPPARVLYFVTKGQPSDSARAFLAWVLKDGQKFVGEMGYVQLPDDVLQAGLNKLK